MKKTSIMKAYHMKRSLLVLAVLACIGSIASAQTYRPLTGTRVVLSTSYPSGNALTLQANPTAAYTLTLPDASPTAGDILRSDPTSANTLIWTSPLDMYVFENGLTESGSNTVKWGGSLTAATTINTAGGNALTFYNNTAASTAAFAIGGGAGTLTLDVQGGTTINTTGNANTSIGNGTGTLTLTSAGLNVTSAGMISDANSSVIVDDDVEPSTNDNFSLGTNSARWSDVYVGPSTVHIGSTTVGGDELALSYNTTSNTAIFNVGSTSAMELTSAALTLTANLAANGNATLGNGGDNVSINAGIGTFEVASAGVDISTAGAISSVTTLSMSGALTNTLTTNQLILGTTQTTTINAAAPAASRVYTIPDVLADASFVMTAGAQTIAGTKTFSAATAIEGDLTLGTGTSATGGSIIFNDDAIGSSNTVTLKAANHGGNRTYTMDDISADASFVMTAGTQTIAGAKTLSGDLTLSGTIQGASPLVFEGTTVDANQTTFAITDPTADNTITFPDVSGTVITTGNTSDLATLAWLVGGNTITGGTTTRQIGLAAQGSNDDALAIMTDGVDRLTITAAGDATFSGALTSTGAFTANGNATLGNGGDNVSINAGIGTFEVASAGVDISTAGAISSVTTLNMSGALTNTLTTNQLILGTTNTTTINAAAPAASRVYTIPDVLADASFVMTAGAQTIAGTKTFSAATAIEGDLTLGTGTSATGGSIIFNDDAIGSSNTVTLKAANHGGNRTYTMDDISADASFVMTAGTQTIAGAKTLSGDLTLSGTIQGASPLVFEGTTVDANQTTFAITDPTADRTITFPDVSGTVITTGNTSDLATLTWLVGGNTITGGPTTRRIGIATQAANDDDLAIMTDGTDRLTITAAGVSTFSGTLTSTGDFAVGASTFSVTAASGNTSVGGTLGVTGATSLNGNATLGDNASDVVTVTGTIAGATPLVFEGATANGFETSFAITDPTAARTITFPDETGTVVLTAGTQTVGGAKTFSSAVSITDNTGSTSTTTGALMVTGGAGIGENLYIGGTLNVASNTSLNGNATLGDATADIVTITGTIAGGTPLVFEGATANDHETSFAITDPTADNTITFPDATGTVITTGNLSSITGFVPYNTTSASNTADANGTAYLFNVQYDGAATGNALGARISSDATGGTNATATGLTLAAVGTGSGTATGLTVSASGGTTNKAINVTAGGIDVDAGGVNVDAGGVTIAAGGLTVTAGGLTVTAGLSTFSQGMKIPITVASAAATYTADDDDYVIVQTAVQGVTFPTGADGRVIVVKNTSGSDITLTRGSTDTFEGAATTLTLTTGTSQTFVFSGGVWYLIGN